MYKLHTCATAVTHCGNCTVSSKRMRTVKMECPTLSVIPQRDSASLWTPLMLTPWAGVDISAHRDQHTAGTYTPLLNPTIDAWVLLHLEQFWWIPHLYSCSGNMACYSQEFRWPIFYHIPLCSQNLSTSSGNYRKIQLRG